MKKWPLFKVCLKVLFNGKITKAIPGLADDDVDDGSVIGERGPAKLFFQELKCGICFELIGTLTDSSYPSNEASSSKTLFGIRLSCSGSHAFCLDCLQTHVRTAFEDASFGRCIFPIGCPECNLFNSEWSISDQEASRFLSPEDWDKWVRNCASS